MTGPAPDVAKLLKRDRLIAQRMAYRRIMFGIPTPGTRPPKPVVFQPEIHRLEPGQPDNRALYRWWCDRHSGNTAVIATVTGVTVRTVQRWHVDQALPKDVACLLDQVRNGCAVSYGMFRGSGSARPQWRDEVTATGVFETEKFQW
ncbi:hypothetical protein [Nevskia sp.]|uniref:hypothetical protein n=1 Tax=Nevskia sp. TaxID=1929292 RepID=UPI0025D9E262|nr:hypothetical protein [Nevskia sp.]